MPGHDHMRPIAKEQAAANLHAAIFEVLDLSEEFGTVDDDSVADKAELIGIENSGGNEMEFELAEFVDDRVAGVVASRVPGDDIRFLCQEVYDPTLALVPPLAAHNHYRWHRLTPALPGLLSRPPQTGDDEKSSGSIAESFVKRQVTGRTGSGSV